MAKSKFVGVEPVGAILDLTDNSHLAVLVRYQAYRLRQGDGPDAGRIFSRKGLLALTGRSRVDHAVRILQQMEEEELIEWHATGPEFFVSPCCDHVFAA